MVLIFDGQHCDCGFVGRDKQLERADAAWAQGKQQLFAIYGFKSVGKTRFAKEIILRHWVDGTNVYQLDCRGIRTLNEFIIHVTLGTSIVEQAHQLNWVQVICQCLKNRARDGDVVVFIENAEEVEDVAEVKSAFLELSQELVRASPRVKVIFTSSLRFRFPKVKKIALTIEVPELEPAESKALLREVCGEDVDLGKNENKIVELCCGLPLAIQIAGSELTEDGQQLTPKDLVTLLTISKLDPLSREHYAHEEQMRHVVGGSIDRLGDVFKQYYTSVNYIPGSFTQAAATNILGFDNTAVGIDKAMIPLHRRHLVSFDSATRRYDINPMQREYLMANIAIRDILGVRSRYAKFFSDCLVQLQNVVNSKDSGKALIPLNLDMKNFRKLLDDASFCGEDGTFGVFVKAAMEATFLILYYMPDQSVSFYEVMLDTCREHGSQYESGVLMSIFGEVLSEQQGDYLKGLEWYRRAEAKLRPEGDSRRLAEIYQHMGWYYYVHGPGSKAVKNHLKSYQMLLRLGLEDDLQTARVMNCLGIAYVSSGNARDAEQYHTRGLAIREQHLGENNLTVAMHYNNIGLMYDLMEDYDKALYYFGKGYTLKKELIGPSKTVIISMRNLGLQFIKQKEYKKALALAEENMATFEQVANRDNNTKVNILEVQSIAHVELGEYGTAEPLLREMYEVKKVATPGHSYNRMILKYLGRALRGQGKFAEAGEILSEALAMGDTEGPGGFGALQFEILQELGNLGIDTGDRVMAKECFQRAINERHRWGDYQLKEDKVEKSREAFQEMTDLVKKVQREHGEMGLAIPCPCSHQDGVCCIDLFARPEKPLHTDTIPKTFCETGEISDAPVPGAWMMENTAPIYVPPQTTGPYHSQAMNHQRNPFGKDVSHAKDNRTDKHMTDAMPLSSELSSYPQVMRSGSFQPITSPPSTSRTSVAESQRSTLFERESHQATSRITPLPKQTSTEEKAPTIESGNFSIHQTQSLGYSLPETKAPTPLPTQTSSDEKAPSLSSYIFGYQNRDIVTDPARSKVPTPLPKQTSTDEKEALLESSDFRQNRFSNTGTPVPRQCSADEKAPTLESLSFDSCSDPLRDDSLEISQSLEAADFRDERCLDTAGRMREPTFREAFRQQGNRHNVVPHQLGSPTVNPQDSFTMGGRTKPSSAFNQLQANLPVPFAEEQLMGQCGHHPPISGGQRSRSLEEGGNISQPNRQRSTSDGLPSYHPQSQRHNPGYNNMSQFAVTGEDTRMQYANIPNTPPTESMLRQRSLSESVSSGGSFETTDNLSQLSHPPSSWHPPSGFPSLNTPSPSIVGPNPDSWARPRDGNEQDASHCVISME